MPPSASWPTTIVHVIPGSQYSAKVLAALDSREIPHSCNFAAMRPEDRKLPSGGTMVPEAVIADAIVPDSDAILRHFDAHYGTDFFPASPSVENLAQRVSYGVISGAVLYYNWCHEPTYARTMRAAAEHMLPSWICIMRGAIADWMSAETRRGFRVKAAAELGVGVDALDDEPAIRAMLLDELKGLQACLHAGADYLQGAQRPTAADFSLYAMLERLVGEMGDIALPCSLPELVQSQKGELERLWTWHETMRSRHPIRFKGKRLGRS